MPYAEILVCSWPTVGVNSCSNLALHWAHPLYVCWCFQGICYIHLHRWCSRGEETSEKLWSDLHRRHSRNIVWVLFCLGFSASLLPSLSLLLYCVLLSGWGNHESSVTTVKMYEVSQSSAQWGLRFHISKSSWVMPLPLVCGPLFNNQVARTLFDKDA